MEFIVEPSSQWQNGIDLLARLEKLRMVFNEDIRTMISAHPEWCDRDLRSSALHKMYTVLTSCQLGMWLILKHLQQPKWWDENWQSIYTNRPREGELWRDGNEFQAFLRISFIQSVFSAMESSFRLILRALDAEACQQSTGSFLCVYSEILERLSLQENRPLMELLRLSRNAIHNNNIFFPHNQKSVQMQYKHQVYEFVMGQNVTFLNWFVLFDWISDLEILLMEIISSPMVLSLPSIPDPMVGSRLLSHE